MKTFADDFEAASLPLYQNFRSASRLRRMQNRMIKDMDPAAASPDEDLMGDEASSKSCTSIARSRKQRRLRTSLMAG